MFRRLILLLCGCLIVSACQPAATPSPTPTVIPPTPTPPPTPNPVFFPIACNEPGSVTTARVEETERGYPLAYKIYLPPCYEAETERRYPIIYMVPGRGSGPGTWFAAGLNEVADQMILDGEMPPFIVVGTENTDGDPQAEAIVTDLIPYVESHYRTLTDRAHRAAGGGSLGGIAAYRIALRYPDQYASIGIFGSGVIHGEEPQVQKWLDALTAENRPRVFFNCGTKDPLMLERTNVSIEMFEAVGLETVSIVSEGGHDYGYWVSNIAEYFKWVAEDW